jgi:hypothetical protein
MTTNYSESYAVSTKSNYCGFLSYVPWKGYKQKRFHEDKSLFQSFQPFKPFKSFKNGMESST